VLDSPSQFSASGCPGCPLIIVILLLIIKLPEVLKWNGENASVGTMTGVSNDLRIRKKRKVITRGGSGIFPRGLLVGWVRNVKQVEGKPVWDVMVQFSENYRTLQQVYVVKNLLLKEQKELEQRIPAEVQ
jgi:rod shape-determining protein MreC